MCGNSSILHKVIKEGLSTRVTVRKRLEGSEEESMCLSGQFPGERNSSFKGPEGRGC